MLPRKMTFKKIGKNRVGAYTRPVSRRGEPFLLKKKIHFQLLFIVLTEFCKKKMLETCCT